MIQAEPEPSGFIVIEEADFHVSIANESHAIWAEEICTEMYTSAIERGTGISRRSPEYLRRKMQEGEAVIAFAPGGQWAGFSYIAGWDNGNFVSNSGLIVAPPYRKSGLATRIKQKIFDLSCSKYPGATIFSLTSGLAVMKMNTALGFEPVTYSELTHDERFWEGCRSCVNYHTLLSKEKKNCLCTAMLSKPGSPMRNKM